MSDPIAVPKLPLSRVKSTTGFVWRQADGALFSAAEFEEWLWDMLRDVDNLRSSPMVPPHDPVTRL